MKSQMRMKFRVTFSDFRGTDQVEAGLGSTLRTSQAQTHLYCPVISFSAHWCCHHGRVFQVEPPPRIRLGHRHPHPHPRRANRWTAAEQERPRTGATWTLGRSPPPVLQSAWAAAALAQLTALDLAHPSLLQLEAASRCLVMTWIDLDSWATLLVLHGRHLHSTCHCQ